MCKDFFAPKYATLVADRSLPVAILVGITLRIGNEVIACVAEARALLCMAKLAGTPCA